MANVFLGWTPSGEAIRVEFDQVVSRLIDVGRCKAIVPRNAKIGAFWRAQWHPSCGTYYCQRPVRDANGKVVGTAYLHRALRGLKMGDPREIDHKNGVGLDNSEGNTQVLSRAEHLAVTRQRKGGQSWKTGFEKAWAMKRATSTTGYYGVTTHKSGFVANCRANGKQQYLGKFDLAIDAARRVNEFLKQFDPADPRLNKDLQTGGIL